MKNSVPRCCTVSLPRVLVYHSGSGVTERVARRFDGLSLDEYTGEGDVVLMVPSYGSPKTGNYVPRKVKQFLKIHKDKVVSVVGIGNRTFGSDFCKGAVRISEKLGVPVVTLIDVVPTQSELDLIKEELE